jgi:hypothetical protein
VFWVYDGREYRCDSGHSGHADFEDAKSAASAWVWDCAEGGTGLGWSVQGEPRVATNSATAAGTSGMAGLGVAGDREFAEGEVLFADDGGAEAAKVEAADWKRRSGAIARLLEMEG